MNRVLMLLLAALLCGGCERGAEAPQEKAPTAPAQAVFPAEPEGFRDLAWGTEFAALAGLVAVEGQGQVYTRADEEPTLAGVPLDGVEYRFVDGRFDRAVATLSLDAAQRLKGQLFSAYGPVGPFMGPGPDGEGGYRKYLWQFEKGFVALLLGNGETPGLLIHAAGTAPQTGF